RRRPSCASCPSEARAGRTACGSGPGTHARARADRPRRWSLPARIRGRAGARAREDSWRAEVDPDLLAGGHTEHLRRAAAVDRDRDIPVRVLVEDDVAGPRIGERPRDDGVVALEGELELHRDAGQDVRLLEVLPRQIELHVAEAVDVEHGRADPVLADLWLRHVDPDERLRLDRPAGPLEHDGPGPAPRPGS